MSSNLKSDNGLPLLSRLQEKKTKTKINVHGKIFIGTSDRERIKVTKTGSIVQARHVSLKRAGTKESPSGFIRN